MNGYLDDFSMSERARDAYNEGFMPLSKWTKKEIYQALLELGEVGKKLIKSIEKCKCTLPFLKSYFLENKEWHHTSKFFNKTNFYGLIDDFYLAKGVEAFEAFGNDPETLAKEFNEWKQDREKEKKAKNTEFGKLVWGILCYDVWKGSRNYGRYIRVSQSGYCRRENDWMVLYDSKGKKRKIITKRNLFGNAHPHFLPQKKFKQSA